MLWLRDVRAATLHLYQSQNGNHELFRGADKEALTMRELLTQFSTFKTSLPVDKIFALLGIANDIRDEQGQLLFDPYYRKSPATVNLYLTSFFIRKEKNLDVLRDLASYQHFASTQVATWVPDWTAEGNPIFQLGSRRLHLSSKQFMCSVGGPSVGIITVDQQSLGVCGFMVDKIQEPLSAIPDFRTSSSDDFCTCVVKNWRSLVGYQQRGLSRISINTEQYFRTLNVDGDPEHWHRHFKKTTSSIHSVMGDLLTPLPNACDHTSQEHVRFASRLRFTHWGRRPFVTTTGYIGVGPAEARPGDCVYILETASTPFVLRSVQDEDTTGRIPGPSAYKIVGEAYVDGIMYGELFHKDHRSRAEGNWERLVIT